MGVKKLKVRFLTPKIELVSQSTVQMGTPGNLCFESLHIKTNDCKKNICSWQRRNQLQGICKRTYVKVIFDILHTLAEWISSQLLPAVHP